MMNPEPSNAANRPPQTQPAANTDSPWWLKHGARFMGTASSLAALALGVVVCITLTPSCLLAGILQMICGVVVALVEAPCLCLFLDFAQIPSQFFDRKPHWCRAALYIIISIIPISLCREFSTFIGCGLIFVTGCLYAVMALGKKAPLDEMRVKASSSYNLLGGPKYAGDVESGGSVGNLSEPKKTSGAI